MIPSKINMMKRVQVLWRGRIALWLTVLSCIVPAAHAAEPSLNLGQYKGQVVVVDFWASWCVPCRRSFPWLNEMHAKYAEQGLVIIGVNVDAQRADADRFLTEVPATFAIVYDPKGVFPTQYRVNAMPTSLVYDRAGTLVAQHLGFQVAKLAEYEEVLRKTLATPNAASVAR